MLLPGRTYSFLQHQVLFQAPQGMFFSQNYGISCIVSTECFFFKQQLHFPKACSPWHHLVCRPEWAHEMLKRECFTICALKSKDDFSALHFSVTRRSMVSFARGALVASSYNFFLIFSPGQHVIIGLQKRFFLIPPKKLLRLSKPLANPVNLVNLLASPQPTQVC